MNERLLCGLSGRLAEAGYDVPGVRRLLGRGILAIDLDLLPGLVRRCSDDGSPAARLTAFWLLLQPLGCEVLDSLMGKQTVQALEALSLIEQDGDRFRARAGLYPCLTYHFFADPLLPQASPNGLPVPWLSRSGYALALAAPRAHGKRALDLGCGPGVQTILNAGSGSRSWGMDINPRALEYSRLNALLNNPESCCRFLPGDSEMPSGKFGLITGKLFTTPSSGDDETTFLRDLALRLTEGGTIALAVSRFTPDRPLLDRVERWLGGADGFGLAQLNYASRYLGECETSQGAIESMAEALLFIRRPAGGRRGWRLEVKISPPREQISDQVESWLDAQEHFSEHRRHTSWNSWRPRWSGLEQLLTDCRSGLGMAHYVRDWLPAAALDPRDTFLLGQMDGRKTAGELIDTCAGRWGESMEAARPDIARRLRTLGRRALIV